ncbi:MAG: hypothetical protein JSU94_15705 [Phycisphaerales bacterium]|nr:MAG: hypothetical protein JSU94_15705 [Phycisphaerales bacterium]
MTLILPTFRNACVQSGIFKSWQAKAANDNDAAEKVRRYQHRPGEELYYVVNDPYEWNNLADRPEYAEVKAQLRRQLLKWMEQMGDKGQQTELEAKEHQGRGRNKRPKGTAGLHL